MGDNYQLLGRNIGYLVEIKATSRAELANVMKVSVQAVGQLIRGETKELKPSNLTKAAQALGFTSDELLTRDLRAELWHPSGEAETYGAAGKIPAVYEPRSDYELVKRVTGALLSAGPGHVTFEHEEIDRSHAFRKEWLVKRGLKAERCRVMEVRGESMHPYLNDGDVVLVNLDDRVIRDGEVYAIAVDDEARIKRLFKITGDRVEIRSDNPSPKYRPEVIESDQLERLNIIGRVVWRGG